MDRTYQMTFAFVAVVALMSCSNCAHAQQSPQSYAADGRFSVELESSAYAPLPMYHHCGSSYVEGRFGNAYAIRVFNHTGRRVEAVVTVDGRDVVSGRRGNFKTERGYVIPAYGSVRIDGFRTSLQQVAAFRFTHVQNSYAARMGDPANVGVIGVAVFEERTYRPRPIWPRDPELYSHLGSAGSFPQADKAPSASPSGAAAEDGAAYARKRAPQARQELGTAYGEDTYSPVSETRFARRVSSRPDALLAVYYDDRQGLIDRGVLPDPDERPVSPVYPPVPFPESPDPRFAPPPPPYWD